MLLLDITIVNVALPDIAKDLHSSFSDLQWVVDAYSLGLAALLLSAGSLADRIGRRKVFAGGIVVFTVASLLCALSGTPFVLDLARALQGVGGAAMFATSLALIAGAFSGRERGTAFGIWGATIGGAVAIGPLVGGALTQGIGWQAIFLINLPIGVLALLVTFTRVAESRDEDAPPTDLPGVVAFSGGLFLLIFALVRGNAEGWGSPLIVGFLLGAVGAARRLRRDRGAQPRTRCSTSACSASRPSAARRSPRSRCRRRCSRCSCTSRSTSRTCWATSRSTPACASCRCRWCRSSSRRSRGGSPSASRCAG